MGPKIEMAKIGCAKIGCAKIEMQNNIRNTIMEYTYEILNMENGINKLQNSKHTNKTNNMEYKTCIQKQNALMPFYNSYYTR